MIVFVSAFLIVGDYFRINSDHENSVILFILSFLIVKDDFRTNSRQERRFCAQNKDYDSLHLSNSCCSSTY